MTGHTVDGCEIRSPHHLETMVETVTFVGIYRGIIRNQGFFGGAGIRPQYVCFACGAIRNEEWKPRNWSQLDGL